MLFIILMLLPFVQIGITYYLSVQTAAATLIFVSTAKYALKNSALTFALVGFTALLMVLALMSWPDIENPDLLKRVREALFFSMMCLFCRGFAGRSPFQINKRSHMPIVLVSGALAAFAAVQFVFLSAGKYFGIPKAFYIANEGTLPGLLDLMYARQRPFGTFGEPSYLSFVLISLFVMLSPLVDAALSRNARAATENSGRAQWIGSASSLSLAGCLAIAIAGALSQSLSFYLAFPLFLYVCVIRNARLRIKWTFGIVVIFTLVVALGSTLASPVLNRVSSGGTDSSTSARITKPLQIIPQYLFEHPLGAPFSKLVEAISPISTEYGVPAIEIGHNALFNSFFNYGMIGFSCLALVVSAPKQKVLKLYVFTCLFFNGGIFSVDKFFVVTLTVAVYSSYSYFLSSHTGLRTNPSQPNNLGLPA